MANKIIPGTVPTGQTSEAWDLDKKHNDQAQQPETASALFTTQTCRHPETGELVTGEDSNVSR